MPYNDQEALEVVIQQIEHDEWVGESMRASIDARDYEQLYQIAQPFFAAIGASRKRIIAFVEHYINSRPPLGKAS